MNLKSTRIIKYLGLSRDRDYYFEKNESKLEDTHKLFERHKELSLLALVPVMPVQRIIQRHSGYPSTDSNRCVSGHYNLYGKETAVSYGTKGIHKGVTLQ